MIGFGSVGFIIQSFDDEYYLNKQYKYHLFKWDNYYLLILNIFKFALISIITIVMIFYWTNYVLINCGIWFVTWDLNLNFKFNLIGYMIDI